MIELSVRLKDLRLKNGLTQVQLGERVGISKAVISSYENSFRHPSYDVLIKLASVFGVTTDFLLGLDDRLFLDITSLSPEQRAALEAVYNSYQKT